MDECDGNNNDALRTRLLCMLSIYIRTYHLPLRNRSRTGRPTPSSTLGPATQTSSHIIIGNPAPTRQPLRLHMEAERQPAVLTGQSGVEIG
jgi:hypothetical protein